MTAYDYEMDEMSVSSADQFEPQSLPLHHAAINSNTFQNSTYGYSQAASGSGTKRNATAESCDEDDNDKNTTGQKRKLNYPQTSQKKSAGPGMVSVIDLINGSDECIATARDLMIKAAHQAESRVQQTKILDLLNIFREFMEKDGNLPRDVSVLTSQLQRLEQSTQILQTAARQTQLSQSVQGQKSGNATAGKRPLQGQPTGHNNVGSSSTGPTTWSKIAEAAVGQDKGWTVVKPKRAVPKQKKSNRVILLQDETTRQPFSSIQVRDKINHAFKARGVEGPVVAIVNSTRRENIALTTTEAYSAEFLIEKVDIWKNHAPHVVAIKDEPWHKVIIHGVPTAEFGSMEDLSSIAQEIEIFNQGLKIIGQPYWITPEDKRITQTAGSIVVAFETEAEAKQAIRRRLIIGGQSLMAEQYLNIPATTQCTNCQGYGHIEKRCRWEAKCQLCASPHNTRQHICSICRVIGQKCIHLVPKCSNCNGNHTSDKDDCPVRKTMQERFAKEQQQARDNDEDCL